MWDHTHSEIVVMGQASARMGVLSILFLASRRHARFSSAESAFTVITMKNHISTKALNAFDRIFSSVGWGFGTGVFNGTVTADTAVGTAGSGAAVAFRNCGTFMPHAAQNLSPWDSSFPQFVQNRLRMFSFPFDCFRIGLVDAAMPTRSFHSSDIYRSIS